MPHRGSKCQPFPGHWGSCWCDGMTSNALMHRRVASARRMDPSQRHGDRGVSLSVVVTVLLPVLLLAAGVAVDGAEQARAARLAHTVAAEAVRAGCEEGSAAQLVGQDGSGSARKAAEKSARGAEIKGVSQLTIDVEGDAVSVAVQVTRPTHLLSLIGVLEVHGQAREMCTLMAR